MSENSPDCSAIFARLSEYIDGELPADLCEKMRDHIEDCAPCVEFVASLRKSIALSKSGGVRDAEPGPLPAECRDALLSAYKSKFAGS